MAKDYNALAKAIIENIGGEENVVSLTHCITRLRFRLKDEAKANTAEIEKIKGVMKVVNGNGQYQVVIGTDVTDAYNAVLANSNISAEKTSKSVEKPEKAGGVMAVIADLVSGIFMPFMGAFTAAGLIKGFLVLFTTFGWMDKTGTTYQILYSAGDAAFYFMPIFLAFTAGKKFGCSPFITVSIACTLIYPNIINLKGVEGVSFLGIPVDVISYTSSVLPIIAVAWVQSKVEGALNKVFPSMVRNLFVPLLTILILVPLTLIVVGPITNAVANGLGKILDIGLNICPPLFGFLFAAAWPIMIIFGVHWGVVPIALNQMQTLGYDGVLPLTVGCNFGIAAAVLAIFLKTRNKELKETAGSAAISALIGGITEPAIYGVLLRFKKCMAIVCAFNGVGGLIAATFHVVRETQVAVNALTLPVIYSVYGVWGIVALTVAFVGSFVCVYLFGFNDKMLED